MITISEPNHKDFGVLNKANAANAAKKDDASSPNAKNHVNNEKQGLLNSQMNVGAQNAKISLSKSDEYELFTIA